MNMLTNDEMSMILLCIIAIVIFYVLHQYMNKCYQKENYQNNDPCIAKKNNEVELDNVVKKINELEKRLPELENQENKLLAKSKELENKCSKIKAKRVAEATRVAEAKNVTTKTNKFWTYVKNGDMYSKGTATCNNIRSIYSDCNTLASRKDRSFATRENDKLRVVDICNDKCKNYVNRIKKENNKPQIKEQNQNQEVNCDTLGNVWKKNNKNYRSLVKEEDIEKLKKVKHWKCDAVMKKDNKDCTKNNFGNNHIWGQCQYACNNNFYKNYKCMSGTGP